ncbi:hypothetical protein [Deinococcus radiophilus]|uniref:hypothetical protein n=1 Tax=Deinococcus radiophilus TaxID=32062 RepID=UPI00360A24A0
MKTTVLTAASFSLLALLGSGQAQGNLVMPAVSIRPTTATPVPTELARQVLVQPARLEAAVAPGYTTAPLTFTLLSEVATEVYLRPSDPRLVFRGPKDGQVSLTPYTLQSVSFLAMTAHNGVIDILNAAGERIAQARIPFFHPRASIRAPR